MQGLLLLEISSIHWGSLNFSPTGRGAGATVALFHEIHWQWKTSFHVYNNNLYDSYILKVKYFNVFFHCLFSDLQTLHKYLFAFIPDTLRWGDVGPVNQMV